MPWKSSRHAVACPGVWVLILLYVHLRGTKIGRQRTVQFAGERDRITTSGLRGAPIIYQGIILKSIKACIFAREAEAVQWSRKLWPRGGGFSLCGRCLFGHLLYILQSIATALSASFNLHLRYDGGGAGVVVLFFLQSRHRSSALNYGQLYPSPPPPPHQTTIRSFLL